MATPSWHDANNGSTAVPGDIEQFLGAHEVQIAYQGTSNVSNTTAQASQYSTNGLFLDQPFVLPNNVSEVDRVELRMALVGAGTDVVVQLEADSGGNPSGTALAIVTVPLDFLASGVRWVSVPLYATGLTGGATYHIVVNAAGDATNSMNFGASGSATPALKTSTNGSTWSATATQLMFNVFIGNTGPIRNVVEDAGARWVECAVDSLNRISALYEYVGSFRNSRTVSYDATVVAPTGYLTKVN